MRLENINPLVPATFDIGWSVVVVILAGLQIFLFLAAVWSVMSSARLTRNGRLLWVLVVFAFPFLGAIAWFTWGRSARLDRGAL